MSVGLGSLPDIFAKYTDQPWWPAYKAQFEQWMQNPTQGQGPVTLPPMVTPTPQVPTPQVPTQPMPQGTYAPFSGALPVVAAVNPFGLNNHTAYDNRGDMDARMAIGGWGAQMPRPPVTQPRPPVTQPTQPRPPIVVRPPTTQPPVTQPPVQQPPVYRPPVTSSTGGYVGGLGGGWNYPNQPTSWSTGGGLNYPSGATGSAYPYGRETISPYGVRKPSRTPTATRWSW